MPHIADMRAREMQFVEYRSSPWARESKTVVSSRIKSRRRIDPRQLDVVLVPLVAFDDAGWRLGFGAGFYDRKFAFLLRRLVRKPLLIGLGYELQRVERQNPSQWDVPLHATVTEQGIRRSRGGSSPFRFLSSSSIYRR